mgnify:CR=1 FL=1
MVSLRFTDRDMALIRWINGFSFVEAPHITRLWRVDPSRVRHRIPKFIDAGVLSHDRIFVGLPGVYRATSDGVALAGDDLPPVKKVNLQNYHHDRRVVSLALYLFETVGADFLPDRRVRHQLGLKGVGQPGHVPDGVIEVGGKRIAIELELTAKGSGRRKKILDGYRASIGFKEVWYYAASGVIEGLREFQKGYPFLRIMEVPDGI